MKSRTPLVVLLILLAVLIPAGLFFGGAVSWVAYQRYSAQRQREQIEEILVDEQLRIAEERARREQQLLDAQLEQFRAQ